MESVDHARDSAPPGSRGYAVATVESVEMAQREVERLERGLAVERERRLRLLADFENYRWRSMRERAGAQGAGRRDVLLALLDVMDDFDRALSHVGDAPDAVADGLYLTRRRLDAVLRSFGVAAFDSVGQRFDPAVHEATSTVESDEHEPGEVYSEDRRGYLVDGELLRPARVTVVR
jgi:molecular chaperone GrpE